MLYNTFDVNLVQEHYGYSRVFKGIMCLRCEQSNKKARPHKARRMQHLLLLLPLLLLFGLLLCQTCSRPQPTSILSLTTTGTPPFPPSSPTRHPPNATHFGAELTCTWRPEAVHNSVR